MSQGTPGRCRCPSKEEKKDRRLKSAKEKCGGQEGFEEILKE